MAWIENKPLRLSNDHNSVKIKFVKSPRKKLLIELYISRDLLEKLSANVRSKVKVFFDERNPRKILIKKEPENSNDGYQLTELKVNGKPSNFVKLQMRWMGKIDEKEDDLRIRFVNFAINEQGLVILAE